MITRIADEFSLGGIIFSAQMHGIQLKRADGSNLTPFITWQDSRCLYTKIEKLPVIDYINQAVPAETRRRTGTKLKSSHSICKLVDLLRDLPGQTVRLALLVESVIEELSGQVSAMSPSMAASTGLYDLAEAAWSQTAIDSLNLQSVRLPPIQQDREPVAEIDIKGRHIPIFSTIGDHQAAVLGCLPSVHDVVLNISTGAQISYLVDGLQFGDYETRPYFDRCSLRAMTHMPSGRTLNVLMDLVIDIGKNVFNTERLEPEWLWQQIDRLTTSAEPDGLLVDPAFYSISSVASGGSISGICEGNLRVSGLFCATYEAMARHYYASCQSMQQADDPLGRLICSGGLIRKSAALRRYVSQIFGQTAQLSPFSEDVLIGLMRLGYWFGGYYATVAETGSAMAHLKPPAVS
jgi:sugar (pentulose or hexulose) kinase